MCIRDSGITLDDKYAIFFRDGLASIAEAEYKVGFMIEVRIRRIQIFGLTVVEYARAESQNTTTMVSEGKHQAAAKTVAWFAIPLKNETGGHEITAFKAFRCRGIQHGSTGDRRKSKPVFLDDWIREAATCQVFACRSCRIRFRKIA